MIQTNHLLCDLETILRNIDKKKMIRPSRHWNIALAYPSGVKGFNNKMAIWRLAATHGPEAVQTNTPINEKNIRKKNETYRHRPK